MVINFIMKTDGSNLTKVNNKMKFKYKTVTLIRSTLLIIFVERVKLEVQHVSEVTITWYKYSIKENNASKDNSDTVRLNQHPISKLPINLDLSWRRRQICLKGLQNKSCCSWRNNNVIHEKHTKYSAWIKDQNLLVMMRMDHWITIGKKLTIRSSHYPSWLIQTNMDASDQ